MLLCGQISMWSSTAPAAALTDSFFLFAQAFTEHIRPVANTSDDTNLWRYINSIIIFRTIGSIDPEG